MDNRLIFGIIGIAVGIFIMKMFFWPEITVIEKETIVIDSTYVEYKERYESLEKNRISLSDSIEFYKDLYDIPANVIIRHDTVFKYKPFEAPLRRFKGSQPFLYGNTTYNAVVAGELINIAIENDFKIPHITNTITKETTKIIHPRGLYLGGSVSDNIDFSAGASYLDNKWLFDYNYNVMMKSHSIGVKRKIF